MKRVLALRNKEDLYCQYESILEAVREEVNPQGILAVEGHISKLSVKSNLASVFTSVACSFEKNTSISSLNDTPFHDEAFGEVSFSLVSRILSLSQEYEKLGLANYHAIVKTLPSAPPLYRYTKDNDSKLFGARVSLTVKNYERKEIKATGTVLAVSKEEISFHGVEGYHPACYIVYDKGQRVPGLGQTASTASVTPV